MQGIMENHNVAQTPAKSMPDFLGNLGDFNFAEHGIGGGLDPQFFNFSPNLLNPPASLEKIWLSSPWPRGADFNPQGPPMDLQRAMQTAAALLDSASRGQKGIAKNSNGVFLPPPGATPQRNLSSFPQLEAPSRATVGTQTSPGLECNGQFYGKIKPGAKRTTSVAEEPVAGNNSNFSFPQEGASLPPLPKKTKIAPSKMAGTSRPSLQPNNNNNNTAAAAGNELTGTSLPSNAPIPSRGAKALDLAKVLPSAGALPPKNTGAARSRKPPKTTKVRVPTTAAAATATAMNTGAGPSFQGNANANPTVPPPFPSTFTAPTTTTATAPSAATTTATGSDYDTLMCEVCGLGEPEESIILCDWCDDGYHMGCLCPALTEVPTGAWFCAGCCAKRAGTAAQPRQQHLASGNDTAMNAPLLSSASLTQAPLPTIVHPQQQGPLRKRVARFITLFSSPEPPAKPSKLSYSQLQILLFLAQYGPATSSQMRLHYHNSDISNGARKLLTAGAIHSVAASATKAREHVYALEPTIVPTIGQWERILKMYAEALAKENNQQKKIVAEDVEEEEECED
jgi:hypothetical protein